MISQRLADRRTAPTTVRWRVQQLARTTALYGLLSLIAAVFVLPFLVMIAMSLQPNQITFQVSNLIPRQFSLQTYADLFRISRVGTWFWNSTVAALSVVFLQLLTSSLTGYAFARGSFRGRDLLFWSMMAMMMIPGTVTLIPAYVLVSRMGLANSLWALILPHSISIFGIFLCRQYLTTIPRSYDEAALIDGASYWQIYRLILLPLMKPVLATLAVLGFLGEWNDFLWPLVVLQSSARKTLTVGLATLLTQQGNAGFQMAGATIGFLPTLLFFLLLQRHVVKGLAVGGLKG